MQDSADALQQKRIDLGVDHKGSTVSLRSWICPHAKASVVVLHDIAKNTSVYSSVAPLFVEHGYNFYAFDIRGHGRSGKSFGDVASFESLLSDLIQVLAWVRHESPDRIAPVVIAEGYASVILFSLEKRYQSLVKKAVFVKPSFAFRRGMGSIKTAMLAFFAELFPKMLIRTRHAIRLDEHALHSKLSTRFLHGFVVALERYPLKLLRWQVPSLILRNKGREGQDFMRFKEYLDRHKMEFQEGFLSDSKHASPLAEIENIKVICDWIS